MMLQDIQDSPFQGMRYDIEGPEECGRQGNGKYRGPGRQLSDMPGHDS
jgi:hypothetical protein